MKITRIFLLLVSISIGLNSCKKNSSTDAPSDPSGVLDYGSGIFYLKNTAEVKSPKTQGNGTYSAFPDDLKIDPVTGKITVSVAGKSGQSQTGLKYKIKFTPASGTPDSTYIVISGINYQDRIYKLTDAGSKIFPIYNGDMSLTAPTGVYTSDRDDLVLNSKGEIDFKATVQEGFFSGGSTPNNEAWREVELTYKPNDPSEASNKINLIVYYYDDVTKIPSNVSQVMRAHQSQLLGIPAADIPITNAPVDDEVNDLVSLFKPRPPCIIIVGH